MGPLRVREWCGGVPRVIHHYQLQLLQSTPVHLQLCKEFGGEMLMFDQLLQAVVCQG